MLSLVLGVMLCAATSTDVVPGIERGVSTAEVATLPNVSVVEETHVPEGRRPRFDHIVYFVKQHRMFDMLVDMRFEFFNGELMQIDLYPRLPDERDQVRDGVARMHDIDPARLVEGETVGEFRVFEAKDAWGKAYISVSVSTVLSKFSLWIERFS